MCFGTNRKLYCIKVIGFIAKQKFYCVFLFLFGTKQNLNAEKCNKVIGVKSLKAFKNKEKILAFSFSLCTYLSKNCNPKKRKTASVQKREKTFV